MNRTRIMTTAAVAGVLMILTTGPVAAAATAQSAEDVFEREVLQAKLTATGEPKQSRLYSQLTVEGQGRYQIADPTSTRGLRNLNGFGRPATEDDTAVWDLDVDGTEALRTVSDYDGELPLEVSAEYVLDGETIAPDDLVGRSGTLTTTYTVRNVSVEPTEIEFRDAYGARQTETVDLPVPLAGQFESLLNRNYTDVIAEGGVVAGDGRGNTKLKWTLILFEPLGALEQTLSYTAEVTDVVVPPASVQVVPVTMDQAPLSTGNAAYSDAARSTYELTQGATTIDRNLLRLATGAGQLLDGLVKLSDGATQLNEGLGEAASGSGRLADGLVKADDGGTELGAGLVKLSDGSLKLSAGMSKARAGGAELAAGLGRLGDGSQQLSDGMGAAQAGGKKLATGLGKLSDGSQRLSDGLGTAYDGGLQLEAGAIAAQKGAKKAANGAAKIEQGMRDLEAGLLALADDPAKLPALIDGINAYRAQALGGIAAAVGTQSSSFPGGPGGAMVPSARAIGKQVKDGLDAGSANLLAAAGDARTSGAALQALGQGQIDTVVAAKGLLDCGGANAAACGVLDTLLVDPGANASLKNTVAAGMLLAGDKANALEAGGTALGGASAGMAGQEQILAGVFGSVSPGGSADQGLDRLIGGVNLVRDGVRTDAAGGAKKIADFQGDLAYGLGLLAGKDGLKKLADGVGTLSDGLDKLNVGGEALAAGAGEAATGSLALSDGLGKLNAGGQKLSAGAGRARVGAGALADGLVQLDDGGKELAAGAGKAADGGNALAEGLHQLRDGGGRLASGLSTAEDGSGRLADGLTMAKIGGGQVADGAKRLNEEGTSVLAGSVNDANADQNRNVALVRAMDERSRADGMPAGAPEGATSSAVYSFELAGADGTQQRNALRLGLTGATLVAMLGLGLLRRRVLGL